LLGHFSISTISSLPPSWLATRLPGSVGFR
jgi:hypothetical protein